jgi:hypothetical protein
MGFTFRFGYNIFRIAHLLFASLIYISGAAFLEWNWDCSMHSPENTIP